MIFPKTLKILLLADLVRNTTRSGEVTDSGSGEIEMIDLLSQALGFSYTVYSTDFREYGDLILGDFTVDEITYGWSTYPSKIGDTTFAVSKTDYTYNSLAVMRPFTIPVWVAFIFSVALMTFATFLIFRGRVPFSTVLFYASVTLLGQHRDWKPKYKAQKLVVLSWSVGTYFLTLGYTAVLLSFLTVPSREKGITNFLELHDAIVNRKATVLKFEDASTDRKLIESGSEIFKLIGEKIQKQNIVTEDNFLEVIKPNVAVFGSRSLLEAYYGGDEHFICPDSAFIFLRVMYDASENGFCCMDKVNQAIHRIWSSGLYKKKLDDSAFDWMLYYRSIFPDMYSRDENTILPLSMSDLSGASYLLLIGHILGLICFVYEMVTHRYYCMNKAIPNYTRAIGRNID